MNLKGMSSAQLRELAARATALAKALEAETPTYALAIEAGVKEESYRTYRYGHVPAYSGQAIITMANGKRWRAIGHRQEGTPESIDRDGYIEFIPIDDEPTGA